MFKVFMTNFGYYIEFEFNTIDEAKQAGINTGFQFRVVNMFDGVIEYSKGD